jgi:O-antigen ligase
VLVCGAALGLAGVLAPVKVFAAAAGAVMIFVGLVTPGLAAGVGLLALVPSPHAFLDPELRLAGFEVSTAQTAFVLTAMLPLLVRTPHRRWISPPIAAYLLALLASYTLADFHPELGLVQPLRSFAALALGPLLFSVGLSRHLARRLLALLALLPLVGVMAGATLTLAGVHDLVSANWGVFRLQGAGIPTHLAMLGLTGLFAGIVLARNVRAWLWVVGLDLAVTLFTGTRAFSAAALLLVGVAGFAELRPMLRRGPGVLVPAFGVCAVVAVLVLTAAPNLVKRFADTGAEDHAINTSGRIEAWNFYYAEGRESPWFGRGLGASTVANQGDVHWAFRVPHNEYLRLFVDAGIIGGALILVAFGVVLRRALQRMGPSWKLVPAAYVGIFMLLSVVDNTLSAQQFAVPFWLGLNAAGRVCERSGPGSSQGVGHRHRRDLGGRWAPYHRGRSRARIMPALG